MTLSVREGRRARDIDLRAYWTAVTGNVNLEDPMCDMVAMGCAATEIGAGGVQARWSGRGCRTEGEADMPLSQGSQMIILDEKQFPQENWREIAHTK